nr:hypothetical protein [Kibdelosporangium sp. MJ126-NF4]
MKAVTVVMGVVVGLTFLFGFGNVLNLALRLGVTVWVAPLVAAVDLSILGLLLGTRHLALHGATPEQLHPARRLLIFASLALNIAEPIVAGDYGKAAFDAVGPLLLIGWAEVGPGLLHAITAVSHGPSEPKGAPSSAADSACVVDAMSKAGGMASRQVAAHRHRVASDSDLAGQQRSTISDDDLLERARQEDARHRAIYQRPISAETLREAVGGWCQKVPTPRCTRASGSTSAGRPRVPSGHRYRI